MSGAFHFLYQLDQEVACLGLQVVVQNRHADGVEIMTQFTGYVLLPMSCTDLPSSVEDIRSCAWMAA